MHYEVVDLLFWLKKDINLFEVVSLSPSMVFMSMCLCVFVALKDLAPPPPPADSVAREPCYASGQYFFEYLVVVSLKKSKEGNYEPQITYQFPKVSLIVNLMSTCKNSRTTSLCILSLWMVYFLKMFTYFCRMCAYYDIHRIGTKGFMWLNYFSNIFTPLIVNQLWFELLKHFFTSKH